MVDRNVHGLSRTIPADVKRAVRKRCGFGCVICGLSIYDYEHFEPEFRDAKEHDPEGITLLCPNHHRRKTGGILTRESVIAANMWPASRRQGFSSEAHLYEADSIVIQIGGATFKDCRHLIEVNGIPILSVLPAEEPGGPFRLSGVFTNVGGATTLRIEDNEFLIMATNWDAEIVGRTMTIRNGPGDIALELQLQPPNSLIVSRLDMTFLGLQLRASEDTLQFRHYTQPGWSTLTSCSMEGGMVGISLHQRLPHLPEFPRTSLHY